MFPLILYQKPCTNWSSCI